MPVLLLSPWAGSLADRVDRRRLLLCTQLVSTVLSATLAALAFAGVAEEWDVIALSGALGVAAAIGVPSQQALIACVPSRA